jgi:hypothetical protein
VLQHVWPVSSYLHKSGELGFLTIAHLLEFVVSPTMYCLFPPQREISLQFLNVSGRECHCLVDEASALHHACFDFSDAFAEPFNLGTIKRLMFSSVCSNGVRSPCRGVTRRPSQ